MRSKLYIFSAFLLSLAHALEEGEVEISGACATCYLDTASMHEHLTPKQIADIAELVECIANGIFVDPINKVQYKAMEMSRDRMSTLFPIIATRTKITRLEPIEDPRSIPPSTYCQVELDTAKSFEIKLDPRKPPHGSSNLTNLGKIDEVDVYFDPGDTYERFEFSKCNMLSKRQFIRILIDKIPQHRRVKCFIALLAIHTGGWLHKIINNPNPNTRIFEYGR